ncbi:histidine phosphatase family protein [Actinocorallia longicatena]|uniref:Histidine phosphatase family protein n=1 Tax=Actinocorallia longicatena TaxID=111803 RepID=A0ABP6QA91_9ACTN
MGELIILRHGETEWSKAMKHTGRTDIGLTPHGEDQARALAPLVGRHTFVKAYASPATRARRTAELAGVPSPELLDDLWEWDYGRFEGLTTPEIRETIPGWYVWENGTEPGATPGETADEVGDRVDRVIAEARTHLADGDVALVAHGHVLRILTARWLGLPADHGRLFALDTGTASTLGYEHSRPVIRSWNVPPS